MNITKSIGDELGVKVSHFLNKTPEIQIYANISIDRYQWRDGRYRETCDVWSNKNYKSRLDIGIFLCEYLINNGDL